MEVLQCERELFSLLCLRIIKHGFVVIYLLCGSRKYPYPHHGGNWKFLGGGGSKTQEIREGRGFERWIWFPDAL